MPTHGREGAGDQELRIAGRGQGWSVRLDAEEVLVMWAGTRPIDLGLPLTGREPHSRQPAAELARQVRPSHTRRLIDEKTETRGAGGSFPEPMSDGD